MKKIEAKIVADSVNKQGNRITTFLLTYPRFIHSELMTHRMFSRNSASSRAIPFERMVKMVTEDPFIPIAWQKDHKGMQGSEYVTDEFKIGDFKAIWLSARDKAIQHAKTLQSDKGTDIPITKQLCNRLLEPFMWHTVLVTATEYENFFSLRCPQYGNDEQGYFKSKKDALKHLQGRGVDITNLLKSTDIEWQKINKSQAEIHIQALAEAMWDAMNESTPKQLKSGEWHLPFSDKINDGKLAQVISPNKALIYSNINLQELRLKVCVSRCARLSYMTFDGEIDYEKDIRLHDQLLNDGHASPMEHCAQCQNNNNWYANFKGWKSYRKFLEEDNLL